MQPVNQSLMSKNVHWEQRSWLAGGKILDENTTALNVD